MFGFDRMRGPLGTSNLGPVRYGVLVLVVILGFLLVLALVR